MITPRVAGPRLFIGLICLMIALVGQAPPAHAETGVPPDIVILCEPSLRPMLEDMAKLWRREAKGSLRLFSSSTDAGLKQAGYGARADVIFGAGERAARQAVAQGLLKSDDLIGLWRDRLVLATTGTPSASTRPLAAEIGSARIATINGTLTESALQTLSLAGAPLTRHISAADSDDAIALVADGTVTLAILFASDLKAQPRLKAVAAIPDEMAPAVLVWAGESQQSRSPEMGHFAGFLKETAVQSLIAAYGLEKVSP
jgi:molybdate transport system substrate-binding protein